MRVLLLFCFSSLSLFLTACDDGASSGSAPVPWCPFGRYVKHGRCTELPLTVDFSGTTYQSELPHLDGYRGVVVIGSDVFTAGSVWGGTTTPTQSGVHGFVSKAASTAGWVSAVSTSPQWTQVSSLVTDGTRLIVSGMTYGPINNSATANGDADAFIAVFNTSGTMVSATQLGTSGVEWIESAAVNGTDLYVVGTTNATLGGATGLGKRDVFVAKYSLASLSTDAASPTWVKQLGTDEDDHGTAIAVDSSGHLFVAGTTYKLDSSNLAQSGGDDALVWSLSQTDGSVQWSKRLSTLMTDRPTGMTLDSSGNVIVAGLALGKFAEVVPGIPDIFVAKYSSNGDLVWGPYQYGTPKGEYPAAVVGDPANDRFFVAGSTSGDFAGEEANQGGLDAFVAEISMTDGLILQKKQLGSLARDAVFAVALASDGVVVAGESEGNITGLNADGIDSFWAKFPFPF